MAQTFRIEPRELERARAPGAPDPFRRTGVYDAVRRHLALAILPVLLLCAGATAYALLRTPTYTAQVRLTVGRFDLNQPGALTGYQSAAQALASLYSRSVASEDVLGAVARRNGLSLSGAAARLSSSTIVDSPVFIIEATGPSEREAISIANDAALALQKHVDATNLSSSSTGTALLRRYRALRVEVNTRIDALQQARRAESASSTAATRAALSRAKADYLATKLRADAASAAYSASFTSTASSQSAEIVARAIKAKSDRLEKLQILVFGALLAGLFLGGALAVLAADRELRRTLAEAD